MLRRILHTLSETQTPISLYELGRKLDVSPSALAAMIAYGVRKGRLQIDEALLDEGAKQCVAGACGKSCPSAEGCPFLLKLPSTISTISSAKRSTILDDEGS